MRLKLAITILLGIVGLCAFAKQLQKPRMFMETPKSASDLNSFKVPKILKSKITKKWISNAFSINEENFRIRDLIFDDIKNTPGACPCPYLLYKKGDRRCGGNSSYSKQGGTSPICYPADVIRI